MSTYLTKKGSAECVNTYSQKLNFLKDYLHSQAFPLQTTFRNCLVSKNSEF